MYPSCIPLLYPRLSVAPIWLGTAGPSLLTPLLISPVWVASTVRPHIEEARDLSSSWSLHLWHLSAQITTPRFNTFRFISPFPRCKAINQYEYSIENHLPRYFRYFSGWESKYNRYLQICMSSSILKFFFNPTTNKLILCEIFGCREVLNVYVGIWWGHPLVRLLWGTHHYGHLKIAHWGFF